MSILAILFLLLLVFVLWPVLKLAYKLYTIRRQFRNAYRQASAMGGDAAPGRREPHTGPDARSRRRAKRIDSNVGTYVEFEELDVDLDQEKARQYRNVEFERQQQVSDAEWEEIK